MIYELLKDRIINGSSSGQEAIIQSLSITANGTYTAPADVDGYSPVVVNVPERVPVLEDKNITSNGTFSASSGFDGLGTVVVDVPERVPVVESIDITANGTYTPNEGVDGYNSVNVQVPERVPVVESKEITQNGTYTPPQGVDGFNNVVVNVASSGGGKAKRIELTNGGQQYLFNNYFLDLLDYGCEVVFTNTTQVHNFIKLASGTGDVNNEPAQNITGENVDKFASLKINVDGCTLGYSISNMFYQQKDITHLPEIVGNHNIITNRTPDYQNMFYGCHRLQEIPDNYIDLMIYNSQHNSYIGDGNFSGLYVSSMFSNCHALRKIPTTFSTTFHKKPISRYNRTPQYWSFNACYSLGELVDLPVVDTRKHDSPYTSNSFSGAFNDCQRLKRLTFKLDEQSHTEGNETITVYSPATAYWKNQTIDLAGTKVGYGGSCSSYNPSFTNDNMVKDDATYQALKDTEDWWTLDIAYSRYNHNSAVETINSLPQIPSDYTDAGNTIKFNGASGSATDGGAINTLTQEEIAVATAKGWTVALV